MRTLILIGLLLLTGSHQATALSQNKQKGPTDKFELFIRAIDEGQIELVRYFLTEGIEDLNQPGRCGHTPLMTAAVENHDQIAQILIDAGADVNMVNPQGSTALAEAANEGAVTTAKVLLAAGAKIKLSNQRGASSPLARAAAEGHTELVHLLLANAEDLVHENGILHPIHLAAGAGHIDVVYEFLAAGTPIDLTDETGRTALSHAAREGFTGVVSFLLKKGATPDGPSPTRSCPPLHVAVAESQPAIIRLLANAGAELETKYDFQNINKLGNHQSARAEVSIFKQATPLMIALSKRSLESVRILIQSGVSVNTTAHKRAYLISGNVDARRLASITACNSKENHHKLYDEAGWTPLMEAVVANQPALVKVLLDAGADVAATTDGGLSAPTLARQLELGDIIQLLD